MSNFSPQEEDTLFRKLLPKNFVSFDPNVHRDTTNGVVNSALEQMRRLRDEYTSEWDIQNPIVVGIVDDLRINAMAARINDQPVVLINHGFIVSLWNLSHTFFTTQDLSSDPIMTSMAGGKPSFDRGGIVFEQTQSDAANAATWVWEQACSWIFIHELTHIVNGHREYGEKYHGPNSKPQLDKEKRLLDKRTFELDADDQATIFSCQKAVVIEPMTVGYRLSEIIRPKTFQKDKYNETVEFVCLSYVHIFLIFMVLDNEWEHEGIAGMDHPPSQLRLAQCMARATGIVKQLGMDLNTLGWTMASLHIQMRDRFIKNYNYTVVTAGSREKFLAPYHPESIKHLQKLFANWKAIRPELSSLSIGAPLVEGN